MQVSFMQVKAILYKKTDKFIEKKDKFQKDGQVYRKDRTLKKPIPKTAR